MPKSSFILGLFCYLFLILIVPVSHAQQATGAGMSGAMNATKPPTGDDPPILSGPVGYSSGVKSSFSDKGTFFNFGITYKDPNGDPPATIQVWVDLNMNRSFEETEKFDMVDAEPSKKFGPNIEHRYEARIFIPDNGRDKPANVVYYRFYASDGKHEATDFKTFVDGTIFVRVGNIPPILTSNSAVTNGAQPSKGRSGVKVKFGVDYQDFNGDPPTVVQVWVDENQNGIYDEDEKHDLIDANPTDPFTSYHHFFSRDIVLKNPGPNKIMHYRFYASDGVNDAEGATFIANRDLEILPLALPVPVEVMPQQDVETVPGGAIEFDAGVLVDFRYAKHLAFAWDKVVPQMSGKNTFRLLGVSTTRMFYDANYDLIRVRFRFETPGNLSLGERELPLSPVTYSDSLDGKNKGAIPLGSIKVNVFPYVLTGPKLSQKAIFVGDTVTYSFSLLIGASMVDLPEYQFDVNHMTFLPFEVNGTIVDSLVRHGSGALTHHVSVPLQFFGVPGSVQIPDLRIGALVFHRLNVSIMSLNPPPEVPKNGLERGERAYALKLEAKPVPPIRLFDLYKNKGSADWILYLALGGFSLVLIFGFYAYQGMSLRGKINARKERELMLRNLRGAYEAAKENYSKAKTRDSIARLYHALRVYILALANEQDHFPGFGAPKLINENNATGALYAKWLHAKQHADEEARSRFDQGSKLKDLTRVVPRNLLEEFESAYQEYFAHGVAE